MPSARLQVLVLILMVSPLIRDAGGVELVRRRRNRSELAGSSRHCGSAGNVVGDVGFSIRVLTFPVLFARSGAPSTTSIVSATARCGPDRTASSNCDTRCMAQIQKQSITVGGSRIVGELSVDGGAVLGESGPLRPCLIVPLTIMMQNRPKESMLAVTEIRGLLCSDQNAFPQDALCAPQTESLTNGFPVRSLPHGTTSHTVHLRFFMTPAEVEHLEALRQSSKTDTFSLYLGLDAMVAKLRTHNEIVRDVEQEPSPWDMNLGLFSEVLPLWDSRIDVTLIQVEQSRWVRDILPGLGYDRIRLLEMTFPPPLPDHTSAAAQFDKTNRALDDRRYGDCILECRGLLNMWEKQFGATSKKRIAEVVADDRGWPAEDIRRDLLDTLWKEVGDVANAPHHPEGDVNSEIFEGRDARLILVLTAALSEYLAHR